MKYDEQKIEAVKILIPEIIELNRKMGSEREIVINIDGGDFPGITARFWDWTKEVNPRETFDISFEARKSGGRRDSIQNLVKKVNEWRELFANSEGED